VTYDDNGASGGLVPAGPTDYPTGVQVPILGQGSLTRPGFTFLGWNSAANGAGSLYAPGYNFAAKTATLYAQWAPGSTLKSCAPTETYATLLSSWYDIPYAQVIADTTSATQTITIYLAAYLGLYGGSSGGEPFGSGIGTGTGPYGIMSFVSKTVITSATITINTNTTYVSGTVNNYSQTITNAVANYWPTAATISSITFPSINSGAPYLYSSPATFNMESSRVFNGCGIGAYPVPFQSGTAATQFYFFNQGVTLNYSDSTNTKFVNGSVSALYASTTSPLNYTTMPRSNYPYVGVSGTTATSDIVTSITIIPSSGSKYINPPMPDYTIQYDPNGATGPSFSYTSIPAPQYMDPYVSGTTSITLRTNSGSLVKTGKTFSGWNTAADGSGTDYAAGATYNGGASLILYAKWT
jgi:uncharacterized repeat protein (TIGR02543 family)